MSSLTFTLTLPRKSLDESGLSSLGAAEQRTTGGHWDALTPTTTLSTSAFNANAPYHPHLMFEHSNTPSCVVTPNGLTQSVSELQGAPDGPSDDELCNLCNEVVALYDMANAKCPWSVIRLLSANLSFIAVMKRGCPAIIRVYKRLDLGRKKRLVDSVLPSLVALSLEMHANYFVQCVIEHTSRSLVVGYVVSYFAGHFVRMCCDKFASNVVEKVIRVCGTDPRVNRLLLSELLLDTHALQRLVQDEYGNFVVQSVLSVVAELRDLPWISKNLAQVLPDSPFATNIWAKFTSRRRELVTRVVLPSFPHPITSEEYESQKLEEEKEEGPVGERDGAGLTTALSVSRQQRSVTLSVLAEESLVVTPAPTPLMMSERCGNSGMGSRFFSGRRYRHSPYSFDALEPVGMAEPADSNSTEWKELPPLNLG